MKSNGSIFFLSILLAGLSLHAADTTNAVAILQDLKSFREMGTVLHVAAHPDDENTQLITYLARGRGYRAAYLSLTRGDGGQNLLGPEFGEELGVARTQELLAARHLDGGQQFFSRAMDFGFSKDYKETLSIWDHQQVLSDVVRVIRTFRPDVIVTRFPNLPGANATHGHHTASAYIALEAFKISGDPKSFPEQLDKLKPWQAKRIFLNGGFGGGGGNGSNTVRIDVGGIDPVLGESFSSIAGRSRAMHKTQGFGNFGGGRGGGNGGPQMESFQLLGGEPATNDIMDGIDVSWNRVAGGAEIGKLAEEAVAKFNPQDPAASLPTLVAIHKLLAKIQPVDSLIEDKLAQLNRIVKACAGLELTTTVAKAEVVPGDAMTLQFSLTNRVKGVDLDSIRTSLQQLPLFNVTDGPTFANLSGWGVSHSVVHALPINTPTSQPYWLRAEKSPGLYNVEDSSLIGRPENPPAFPIEWWVDILGELFVFPDEPVLATPAGVTNAIRQTLVVIPPVTLEPIADVSLFAPGSTHAIEVEVDAAHAVPSGIVKLQVPTGWKVSPASQPFKFAAAGEKTRVKFDVTASTGTSRGNIDAVALIGGIEYRGRKRELHYSHIPKQLLLPPARVKAMSLNIATKGKTVGYLPGAGDSVAECIAQMGYKVTELTGADLTPEKLKAFDAVVVGVRAFNVRPDLGTNLPGLFAYAEAGGNVIVQYNRPDTLRTPTLAPYSLRLSSERVTDENAKVTFLEPNHPALNVPNRITDADFDGWVQERSIYLPTQWNDKFVPLIACNDPGEDSKKSAILVSDYGKGHYIYTTIVWFRELPDGVPGAYRLFANLISLGK